MDDNTVLQRIGRLADEEQELEEAHVGSPLSKDDRERLKKIEVELDQCWDLLRQRRAQEEFGLNPDDVSMRSADTVEHYKQ